MEFNRTVLWELRIRYLFFTFSTPKIWLVWKTNGKMSTYFELQVVHSILNFNNLYIQEKDHQFIQFVLKTMISCEYTLKDGNYFHMCKNWRKTTFRKWFYSLFSHVTCILLWPNQLEVIHWYRNRNV